MKIIRLIKQLNNTETGNGSTHECYVLITGGLNVDDIFEKEDELIDFYDLSSDEAFQIRKTIAGRETRIVGFGEYYSKYDISAGDEVILEKCIHGEETQYYVNKRKHHDSIVLQKAKDDFEILRGQTKVTDWQSKDGSFRIEFFEKRKKRNDSPIETAFYKVLVNNQDIAYKYKKNDLVLLSINDNEVRDQKSFVWKKYNFDVEV